jgi:heme/copper-type cytochrome/quinol oxidase subunit 3
MTRWVQWLCVHTPPFVPWIYAALSLIMLPLARRQRDVLALLLSGLIMESSLLVLAHSRDYRYSHWMVITTMLGALLLATRRYRAARQPAA